MAYDQGWWSSHAWLGQRRLYAWPGVAESHSGFDPALTPDDMAVGILPLSGSPVHLPS